MEISISSADEAFNLRELKIENKNVLEKFVILTTSIVN